jgi:hypothetical protein
MRKPTPDVEELSGQSWRKRRPVARSRTFVPESEQGDVAAAVCMG